MSDIDYYRTAVEDSAERVNDELGAGLRENAYHESLLVELSDRGVPFTTEATIPVMYRGKPVARMHPDLMVGDDELLIVEVKSGRDGTDQLRGYIEHARKSSMDIAGGIMVSFGPTITVKQL